MNKFCLPVVAVPPLLPSTHGAIHRVAVFLEPHAASLPVLLPLVQCKKWYNPIYGKVQERNFQLLLLFVYDGVVPFVPRICWPVSSSVFSNRGLPLKALTTRQQQQEDARYIKVSNRSRNVDGKCRILKEPFRASPPLLLLR